MPAANNTKAAEAKPKRPASAFLSEQQVEDVANASAANDAYVALSKLEEGKPFRYRFLGGAITGYSTWIEADGKSKPVRWRMKPEGDEIPGNLQINKKSGKAAEIKFFLAGFVWDYARERISVLIIDQKTILQELNSAIADPDFGDPQEYDVKITRTVKNDFTQYAYKPAPPKAVSDSILLAFEELLDKGADLEALFDNGNPFDPEASKDTGEAEDAD
jgi:hypothetical protein